MDDKEKEVIKTAIGDIVKEAVESNKSEIAEKIKELEQKFNDALTEVKTVPTNEKVNPLEKAGKFLKALATKDTKSLTDLGCEDVGSSQKAQTEGTNNVGGFSVAPEIQNVLTEYLGNYGLARTLCRVVRMVAKEQRATVTFGNVVTYMVGEASDITESTMNFSQPILYAKKCAGLTVITNELIADSSFSITEALFRAYAKALAYKEDQQFIAGAGNGTSSATEVKGLLEYADDVGAVVYNMATGRDTYAEFAYDDVLGVEDLQNDIFIDGSKWLFHKTVWSKIRLQTDPEGHYLDAEKVENRPAVNGVAPRGMLDGYDLFTSKDLPSTSTVSQPETVFGIFANFDTIEFGDREAVTFAISDSATVGSVKLYQSDQSAVRVIERFDIVPTTLNSIVFIKTGATT